ncbi:PIN domain-containing protein [Jiangella ureilytica]|uniref:PIN domain-containing protein n=1 Tax=Jiangella ureilytica TaxID=2530374 RepID=UPI0013A5E287|nr:PIN domain-containing protein [Jiangella ureilytica]
MAQRAVPVRPIAVLDANVLIPPGLRDLLLSAADAAVFRPVWQSEIEDEVRRNGASLLAKRYGVDEEEAARRIGLVVAAMRTAFPDASVPTELWVPLVPAMMCAREDRHVLAVAAGIGATHVITTNTSDFPARSRPSGLSVVTADRFLREQLAERPALVIEAIESMSARLTRPGRTPVQIADALAAGQYAPRFGRELRRLLD